MNKLSSRLTVGFSSAAHTLSHLVVLLYATVVLALEREWDLSYAELFALSIPMTVMFDAAFAYTPSLLTRDFASRRSSRLSKEN